MDHFDASAVVGECSLMEVYLTRIEDGTAAALKKSLGRQRLLHDGVTGWELSAYHNQIVILH